MVHSIGSSSSFRAVQAAVRRIDSSIKFVDIEGLTAVIRERRGLFEARLIAMADNVRAEAESKLAQTKQLTATITTQQAEQMAKASELQRLATLAAEEIRARRGGMLMRIWNRMWAYLQEQRGHRAVRRVAKETQARLMAVAKDEECAIAQMTNPMAEAQCRLATERSKIDQLDAIANSPDARGAMGEQAVAATLRSLPDDYWVFHDVRLRADRFLRFEGKPVLTAQLDHVIVGPTGLYLVETKCWSRQSANNPSYLDPYEQVGRAGLLLHCLLKNADLPNKVSNLIASHQDMSNRRPRGFTRVIPPHGIARYVMNRRPVLAPSEIARLTHYLQDKTSPGSQLWDNT